MTMSTFRLRVFLVLSVLLVGISLLASTTMASPSDPKSESVSQNPSTHPMPDLPIIVRDTGLPPEVVAEAMAFQEAFGKYVADLVRRFPDQISDVYSDSPPGAIGPNTRGHIQFVEEVPLGIASMDNVLLTGGGVFSIADHQRRARLAADVLADMGYHSHFTHSDARGNVIRIELRLPEGIPQPNKLDIAVLLQNRIQADSQFQDRTAPLNVDLTVTRSSKPIITFQHSRGGNQLLKGAGTPECTSGWSVSDGDFPTGTDGIITAGHCVGVNQFVEPGVTPYSTTLVRETVGSLGDVEFHTTTHDELAEFYSDATTIRDVNSLKATSAMVGGGQVCVYGRGSNVRTCGHHVLAVGACVYQGLIDVCNLARTDTTSTEAGDSGGGWSLNFEAWGVHSGIDELSGNGYFTPVERAQVAVNVIIKTK